MAYLGINNVSTAMAHHTSSEYHNEAKIWILCNSPLNLNAHRSCQEACTHKGVTPGKHQNPSITVERTRELPPRPCLCPFYTPSGPAGVSSGIQ